MHGHPYRVVEQACYDRISLGKPKKIEFVVQIEMNFKLSAKLPMSAKLAITTLLLLV